MPEQNILPLPRQHRKGITAPLLWRELIQSQRLAVGCITDLNVWIGLIFAIGASLFALGCLGALFPEAMPGELTNGTVVNRTFFIGSIPFTTAAFLQLLQAELAGAFPGRTTTGMNDSLRWRFQDPGWRACAYQFIGTVAFNVNTFDAMDAPGNWLMDDLEIWSPNMIGSVLFLASGILAARETWQATSLWQPASIDWCITEINLLGCIMFMIAAVLALELPEPLPFHAAELSVFFTLLGAVCFFIGAVLLLMEGISNAYKMNGVRVSIPE